MASRPGPPVIALVVGVLLVLGLVGLGAEPGTAAVPAACTAPLTGTADDVQNVEAGAPTGVYLWLDQAAWHLRFTHPGDAQSVLTGTVQACAPVHVATYLMQSGDQVATAPDQHAMAFKLYDEGQLDGLEFNASCPTTWTFAFQIDGAPVPPSEIFLGNGTQHPSASTFALPSCSTADLRDAGVLAASSPTQPGSIVTVPSAALLALEQENANWRVLQLPTQPKPLFGIGAAPAAPRATPAHVDRLWSDIGPSLATGAEVALVLALAAAALVHRRRRGTAS